MENLFSFLCLVTFLVLTVSKPVTRNEQYQGSFLELQIHGVPPMGRKVIITFPATSTPSKLKYLTRRQNALLRDRQYRDIENLIKMQSIGGGFQKMVNRMNKMYHTIASLLDNLLKPNYGILNPNAEKLLQFVRSFLTINDTNILGYPFLSDERHTLDNMVDYISQFANFIVDWGIKKGGYVSNCAIPDIGDVPDGFQNFFKFINYLYAKLACVFRQKIQNDPNLSLEVKGHYEHFFQILPLLYSNKPLNDENTHLFKNSMKFYLKQIEDLNLDSETFNRIKELIGVMEKSVLQEKLTEKDEQMIVTNGIMIMLAKLDGKFSFSKINKIPMTPFLIPVVMNIFVRKYTEGISKRGDTGPSESDKEFLSQAISLFANDTTLTVLEHVVSDFMEALASPNSGGNKSSVLRNIIKTREGEIDFTMFKKILQLALQYYGGTPDSKGTNTRQ